MLRIIKRIFFIISVFTQYRLEEVLPIKKLHGPLSFLRLVRKPYPEKGNKYERTRKALESLGPIFVKFGQTLSTRPDLLHPEMAKELKKLQDKVKPFPTNEAVKIIEQSFGSPIDQLFQSFNSEVLASASIAQVHTATLSNNQAVVVKVVRPGIEQIILRDLSAMRLLAKLINFTIADFRRLRLPELVEEFANTISGELDLWQEAANASKLRANFPDSEMIYVPEVHWDLVSKDAMVIERIFATSINNVDELLAKGVDMEKLASRGVEIFFTQVFKHKYFHADMHPGNIFVDITDPQNPVYKAVDFGIMGALSNEDQYYLAENFLAFFNRDYYRVAKLHIDSGWVPAYVKVHELEAAVRKVGEPIFGKPLDEISFGEFLITLIQVAKQFDMIIQPQLLLLQKTVLNVEGLGRVLYPKLDLWSTAKPILEQWMRENYGPKAVLGQFKRSAAEYRDVIPKIPKLIDHKLSEENKQTEKPTYVFEAILLVGFSYIAVMPDLWQATIIRAAAFVILLVVIFSMRRKVKLNR